MSTPTVITASVNSTEYSRYEAGRDTITVDVTIAGGTPYVSESVRVDLIKARRSRDAVAATTTLDFTSNVDPATVTTTFYIPDLVDQDLIHLIRNGKYFVKATDVTTGLVVGSSDDFDICIVTVERLKSDYLFGIDLKATELKAPKFQPSILPLTITELSRTHPLGFHTLTYNYHKDDLTNSTVSVGTGANGTITTTADGANAGDSGNLFAIQVVVPSVNGPMTAVISSKTITVTLGLTGGSPDPVLNTATLIAAAIGSITGFTAAASGTGVDSLSTAEGPAAFIGGTSTIVRTLSWNGGTSVSVSAAGTFILPLGSSTPVGRLGGDRGREYACVKLGSLLALPTASYTEEILIDKKVIDDDTLRRYIYEAVSWVENDVLATPIEPTNVVTERDPTTIQFAAGINAPTPIFTDTDYDKVVTPLTYFVPTAPGTWIQLQTPWPQLLRIDSLYGAIANTRVIDIDLEWIEHSEHGGLVQLVPFNSSIAFDFVGLIWVNALRGATELPNFWHYNAIVGLRDTPYELQELVAKKAAVNALVVAGMALRPGVGSVSLSRDGVSESVSYTTSAQYGIYSGTISAYKDWMQEEIPRLRAKYRGVTLRIV